MQSYTTYCFVFHKFMILVKQKSRGKLQNTKETCVYNCYKVRLFHLVMQR